MKSLLTRLIVACLSIASLDATAFIAQAATAFLYYAKPHEYPDFGEGISVGPNLALAVARDGSTTQGATVEAEFFVAPPGMTAFDWQGEEGIAAVAGQDFAPGIQRIEFQPGESWRVIQVPILDNGRRDQRFLFFQARLTSRTEGLSVPVPVVNILTGENELPTTLDVTQPSRYEDATPLVLLTKAGQPVTGYFQPLLDGRTLVRGEFDAVSGVLRPGLARLDANGELDETFEPERPLDLNTLEGNWVSGFPLSDGRVLKIGGSPINGLLGEPYSIHLLHADGTRDPTWAGVGVSGANGLLKPGGRFDEVRGQLRHTAGLRSVNGIPVTWDGRHEKSVFHFFLTNAPQTSLQMHGGGGPFDASIHLRRLGTTDAAATVHYTTRDVTAVAGKDYVAQSGTVSFAPRELGKIVTIPILPEVGEQYLRDFEIVVTSAEGIEALPVPFRVTIMGARGTHAPQLDRVKRLRDGRVLLGGTGPQGATKLEYSSDLKTWQSLTNLHGGFNGDSAIWLDPSATNAAMRFYRAVLR